MTWRRMISEESRHYFNAKGHYFITQQYGSGNFYLRVNSIKVKLITFFLTLFIPVKMSCNFSCTSFVTYPLTSIHKDFRNRIMFSSVITSCICRNSPCKTNQLCQIISYFLLKSTEMQATAEDILWGTQ